MSRKSRPFWDSNSFRDVAALLSLVLLNRYGENRLPKADAEARHRKSERRYWVVSLILTALLTAGALGSAGFAFYAAHESRIQADAAQQQLEAMRDDQRPWIKVTLDSPSINWFDGTQTTGKIGILSPSVFVQNIGHSPAFKVQAGIWVYVDGAAEDFSHFQKKVCNYFTTDAPEPAGYGNILFPGDRVDVTLKSGGKINASVTERQIRESTSNVDHFNPILVGCADYLFGSPAKHHQTYFAYILRHMIDTAHPNRSIGDFALGATIPAAEMTFQPGNTNNYAN